MSSKNKRNFILQGSILAMAGIFVRIIGMVYRIPVLNIIGSEGNGIYGTAFNVYNIINRLKKSDGFIIFMKRKKRLK